MKKCALVFSSCFLLTGLGHPIAHAEVYRCPPNFAPWSDNPDDDILCVSQKTAPGHGTVIWFDRKTRKVRRTGHSQCGAVGLLTFC